MKKALLFSIFCSLILGANAQVERTIDGTTVNTYLDLVKLEEMLEELQNQIDQLQILLQYQEALLTSLRCGLRLMRIRIEPQLLRHRLTKLQPIRSRSVVMMASRAYKASRACRVYKAIRACRRSGLAGRAGFAR